MNKKFSPLTSIRARLLSAVCMLLVAVIMVISSTYAWFTLSTAPEVKGINTAIGANGALEMALLSLDGSVDETPDLGAASAADKNTSWGNLVDVSDNSVYGSSSITLLPSQLNLAADGKLTLSSLLSTPRYGSDGRVESVEANTVTGTFVNNAFFENENYGFRGVGVASGMTDRELAFRNMKAAAGTSMGLAKTAAAASLNANGSKLANMVVSHATFNGTGTEEYTYEEVSALMTIVNDLLGTVDGEGKVLTTGALQHIENAYIQYIIAYAAQQNLGAGLAWNALMSDYNAGASLDAILAKYEEKVGAVIPTEISNHISKLNKTKADVEAAKATLTNALKDKTTGDMIEWTAFNSALTKLVDPDNMEVNGFKASEVKEKVNELVSSVASLGGITVTMKRGGGVYADVADHCGDFTASIKLNVIYESMKFENLDARMATDAGYDPTVTGTVTKAFYLPIVAKFINEKTYVADAEGSVAKPMTEMYGYILDLAFRTNAADSHLLLQTAAKDRIYNDNPENNEFTWGGGSTMIFTSSSPAFNNDMMKKLMGSIKIVFFETRTGVVLGNAVLDATNTKTTADGLEAAIYLVDASANMITTQADAKLIALTQNAKTEVSVLVYLDGANITNEDVAAEAATSMTGKLNLQFSSSANLVPMEYGDYHVGGGATTDAVTTDAAVEEPTT